MRKIYILLITIMMTTLVGCSSSKEEYAVNIKETYPQSIEYFKVVEKLEKIDNKEDARTLLQELKGYIAENYPYDYSKAKDKSILNTVEDFGIMERLLITASDHIFYEATNHKSTIALNYYTEGKNDIRTDNAVVTTGDFNLRKKVVKNNDSKYKLYNFYENVLIDLKNNDSLDVEQVVSEIKKTSKTYEEKEINDGVQVFNITTDEEILLITYFKNDNKLNSIIYNNMDSLHYESVHYKDDKIEINITLNTLDNLTKQKELFNLVLGV